ncbi:hypothetical protein [Baekduia sp.]|jgi:hypothetical protein|uniref:hypothetical protein n=1 Tax=Baekduia sp. TaxID=2600305 RepID=UPI002E0786DB|nr:hypothetical protein [Baekduia sp.]
MKKQADDDIVYTSLDQVIDEFFPHSREAEQPDVEELCCWDIDGAARSQSAPARRLEALGR